MIEVYDSHLHMGMLSDMCIVHPKEVLSFINKYHVKGGVIMPTARIDGGDNLILYSALYEASDALGFKTALYVNREVLNAYKDGIQFENHFCAMKIHLEAIDFNEQELNDICIMASDLKLPLLIHTSAYANCRSSMFEKIIGNNTNQKFILCHARPNEEALSIMEKYSNVWIDTAFLSIGNLKTFVSHGFEDKILFGSDYPINRWYFDVDDALWYQGLIYSILHNFSKNIAVKLLRDNYLNLFNN